MLLQHLDLGFLVGSLCFNLLFSIISPQMAVILTQSVMVVWIVPTILLSAPPSTLTSLKWTPAMMDVVQVGKPIFCPPAAPHPTLSCTKHFT